LKETVMGLSKERQDEIALPINRARYHLSKGMPETDITLTLIGGEVLPGEIADIIALSKERNVNDLIALRKMTRRGAYGYIVVGAGLLLFVWFAMSLGDVTGRYQGRATVGILLGVGFLGYGAWRWAFPNASISRE
jgi:hypothetical protein